ncbi:MAG: polyphosphate kinase 2 family protein, partial [Candidatus Eisenbacteria bacterium]|nr:polyphosphate kinase 2 family protein [Candidatus Eisenbacteria bacterium]
MNFTETLSIRKPASFRLEAVDPDSTPGAKGKEQARTRIEKNAAAIDELQYRLFAENQRSLLIVLQAIDAGGKDGAIRTLSGGMNPQGCTVTSFKKPSEVELDHDFLWRVHQAVPRRGEIGIWNRSHYEDVLVVRVHELVPKSVWSARYEQINRFEANLVAADVHILKFLLHISRDEQKERFQARLDDPEKHWKFSPADVEERKHWD